MPIDLGQTWRYRQTVTDSTGTPADAGTVAVTITKPDGTTTAGTVTHTAVGLYDVTYTTTVAGLHQVSGTATGGILGANTDVWTDCFTVEQTGMSFVSLPEAIAQLRGQASITSVDDREQLRAIILAACGAIEEDLGRVIAPRTVVDVFDGGRDSLALLKTPLLTVTSIVESGVALTVNDYVPVTATGIIYRGTTAAKTVWLPGVANITVTYRAGYTSPPAVIRQVALSVIERMWQATQQAPHEALDPAGQVFATTAMLAEPVRFGYLGFRAPGVA